MSAISLMSPLIATYQFNKKLKQKAAVARRLGVEPTALSNYSRGVRRMPDAAIAELAEGLDLPMGEMIAAVNIGLESTDEKEKEFWLSRIKDEQLQKLAIQYGGWRKRSISNTEEIAGENTKESSSPSGERLRASRKKPP